ncbi:MAG: hypothetical protein M5R40_13895 [Anaerolineae bacterium]|nr:hypothetical protein [Anaerolineae bacterium]
MRLTETHVVVEQPAPVFTRAVPYEKIVGLARGGDTRAALAYRKPRTPSQARPRLGLVTFEPVEDAEAFWVALGARAPDPLAYDAAQVARFVRGRRVRRAMLALALLLATPFAVIALARVAGALR